MATAMINANRATLALWIPVLVIRRSSMLGSAEVSRSPIPRSFIFNDILASFLDFGILYLDYGLIVSWAFAASP